MPVHGPLRGGRERNAGIFTKSLNFAPIAPVRGDLFLTALLTARMPAPHK